MQTQTTKTNRFYHEIDCNVSDQSQSQQIQAPMSNPEPIPYPESDRAASAEIIAVPLSASTPPSEITGDDDDDIIRKYGKKYRLKYKQNE